MDNLPAVPELDEPELNTRIPLAPRAPALADLITTAPLEVVELKPVSNPICPPVEAIALWPASTIRRAPDPLSPSPTEILTAPPLPPSETPDPIDMDPDVPEAVVPELNTRTPLTPLSPAFALVTVTAPLSCPAPPKPLAKPTAPPVRLVLEPARSVSRPPVPLSPAPMPSTMDLTEPHAVAEPMETEPLEPELEVPELKTKIPLTPFTPALAVLIVTAPLLVASPSPLTSEVMPPAHGMLDPGVSFTRPP
jgi:hypothetical protein